MPMGITIYTEGSRTNRSYCLVHFGHTKKESKFSKFMMSNRPILLIQAVNLIDDMRYYNVASRIYFY